MTRRRRRAIRRHGPKPERRYRCNGCGGVTWVYGAAMPEPYCLGCGTPMKRFA